MQPLAAMTWEEARDAAGPGSAAVLPVGAIEAHGPHLPLETDVIIAQAMARAGAARLAARGLSVVVLPPLTYTAAAFAQSFAGTLSLRPETVTATVLDIAASLARHGFGVLAIANAHLDPAHLASLEAAVSAIRRDTGLAVAFPNLAAKPWALRLGDEFRSGACHAGQFETSIVLAERPELVRDGIRAALPANPASLSRAIRDGKRSFEEAGGARAYFGFPAQATAEEGRATIDVLGAILDEAVQAELGARPGQANERAGRPGGGRDRRRAGDRRRHRPRARGRRPQRGGRRPQPRADRASGRRADGDGTPGEGGRLRRDQRSERGRASPREAAELGPVAVLVNNAGAAASMPIARTSLDDWNRLMAVNATGAFLCTRAFLPGMLERKWGRVVNVASTAGLGGGKYLAAYSAAKHALVGLTRSVAAEVAGTGVTVNAVCPGFVDTEMTAETVSRIVAKTGRTREEALAAALASAGQTRLISRRRGGGGSGVLRDRCRAASPQRRDPGARRERLDERPLRDRQPGGARRAPRLEQRHAGAGRGQDALHRGPDRARRLGPGGGGRLRDPVRPRAGQRAGGAARGRRRARRHRPVHDLRHRHGAVPRQPQAAWARCTGAGWERTSRPWRWWR